MWGTRANWLCWSGVGGIENSFLFTQVNPVPDECDHGMFGTVNFEAGDSLELACPSSLGRLSGLRLANHTHEGEEEHKQLGFCMLGLHLVPEEPFVHWLSAPEAGLRLASSLVSLQLGEAHGAQRSGFCDSSQLSPPKQVQERRMKAAFHSSVG